MSTGRRKAGSGHIVRRSPQAPGSKERCQEDSRVQYRKRLQVFTVKRFTSLYDALLKREESNQLTPEINGLQIGIDKSQEKKSCP